MAWELEILKIAGSAIAGFVVGRLQTSFSDRVSRNKDIQNELLRAIRLCSSAAINYHTDREQGNQLLVKSIHLKHQFWRIRTDVLIAEKGCSVLKGSLLAAYVEFFDAATEYPFEPAELTADIDRNRLARITMTAEELARLISIARPKLL